MLILYLNTAYSPQQFFPFPEPLLTTSSTHSHRHHPPPSTLRLGISCPDSSCSHFKTIINHLLRRFCLLLLLKMSAPAQDSKNHLHLEQPFMKIHWYLPLFSKMILCKADPQVIQSKYQHSKKIDWDLHKFFRMISTKADPQETRSKYQYSMKMDSDLNQTHSKHYSKA